MRMLPWFMSLCLAVALTASAIAQEQEKFQVEVNDDGFVVVSNLTNFGFWQASGVQFRSTEGNLVPLDENDADPFSFLLSNTPNDITLGKLGSVADFDGSWVSSITYNEDAGDPTTDLQVEIGECVTPVAFPIESSVGVLVGLSGDCNRVRYGEVLPGDEESSIRSEAIVLRKKGPLDSVFSVDGYEITGPGAEVFDLLGFSPIEDFQSEQMYDIALDVNAPPGFYRATLSFMSDAPIVSTSFDLQAAIVPEPDSIHLLTYSLFALLGFNRRSSRT